MSVLLVVIFYHLYFSGNSCTPSDPIALSVDTAKTNFSVDQPAKTDKPKFEKIDHGIKINGVPICDLHYALPDCVEKDIYSPIEIEEDIFVHLYNSNAWGNTKSGTSDGASTVSLRTHLQQFILEYNIKSILDAPCGDNTYIAMMDLDEVTYLGIDIVPKNINLNREAYPKKILSSPRCQSRTV